MSTLDNAIQALRLIDNQADLNELAKQWKLQMSYIGSKNKRGLKKGPRTPRIGKEALKQSEPQL